MIAGHFHVGKHACWPKKSFCVQTLNTNHIESVGRRRKIRFSINKCLHICLCTISCKKEAYHSPWNCAQKGSMSHIFFLVSLSHWKLVLFVDWKLRLVAAVESVIHRIPKNSNQSNSRQLLHTWVIPLCLKRCSFRYQGPIGTFFTFWVPIGSLYIFQGPCFQFTFANICFGSLFLLPRVSILSLLGPCCRDLSSLSILCFLWPP